jgi:hypothetical protein
LLNVTFQSWHDEVKGEVFGAPFSVVISANYESFGASSVITRDGSVESSDYSVRTVMSVSVSMSLLAGFIREGVNPSPNPDFSPSDNPDLNLDIHRGFLDRDSGRDTISTGTTNPDTNIDSSSNSNPNPNPSNSNSNPSNSNSNSNMNTNSNSNIDNSSHRTLTDTVTTTITNSTIYLTGDLSTSVNYFTAG